MTTAFISGYVYFDDTHTHNNNDNNDNSCSNAHNHSNIMSTCIYVTVEHGIPDVTRYFHLHTAVFAVFRSIYNISMYVIILNE